MVIERGAAMKAKLQELLKRIVLVIEKRFNFTVSTKIMVPFFVITIMVIAAVSGIVLVKINEQVKDMERKRAANILASIKQRFQEEQKVIENYTRLLAYSSELEQAVMNNDIQRVYQILVPAKEYSNQQRILVYDPQGHIMAQLSSTPVQEPYRIDLEKSKKGIVQSHMMATKEGLTIYASAPNWPNSSFVNNSIL